MTELISWLITALVVALLVPFVIYALDVRTPEKAPPRIPIYDRFGQFIGFVEKPAEEKKGGADATPEQPQPAGSQDS